ncbi:gamma-glutamyltransferase [Xanthomonas theicola]|uniref:Glutathione hydrolase proenzyme n=1 Tax=Xanthomonas theicola TaxID=56464 RepID=A0A2S6ZCK2_9XANT|nr:gamma-glutamyltransferase [Xanthomonas theicola]PPT87065.1 gamma-glutamyltransferase [Xanthomonas theicola]QNH24502.1 gamma-glutamyltransferase [Xanthomonas theicola]
MSCPLPSAHSPSSRRTRWAALLLLLVLPPTLADAPATREVPNTAPRKGNVDDARGYQPIHHPLRTTGGVVVSQSRPASEVGVRILREGGNAIDAAVAVGLAEAVTLPRAGNLGGGGALVIYLARENRTTAFDYYGSAPAATTPKLLLGRDGKPERRASISWKGVAVPGTVAAFHQAHRKYGKLPWAQVVQPSIELAEQGVRLSDDEAMIFDWAKPTLSRTPETRAQFFKPDGSSYAAGETLRQPDLAWSLREIARDGADAFYTGEIAKRIVAASRRNGGILTARDLADYRVRELEPVRSTYRGVQLALAPSPSSGATLAQLLNLIEPFPLAPTDAGSAKAYHLIAEATRLAGADRSAFAGGPPQHTAPSEQLLDKGYARQRAALISPERTLPANAVKAGDLRAHESPDTTHYSVVDAEGNAVGNTYTLSNNFGAAVIAPGTGILLNNSLGNFAWGGPADSPNAPAPGKRLATTIAPFIAFKNGKPWIVAGTPGGGSIISALAQFVVNVVDFKLNIAEAAARPRINTARDGTISYELALSPDTLDRLEALGHKVEPFITQTSIQSIELAPDGSAFGSADPRRPDSAAVGVHEYR